MTHTPGPWEVSDYYRFSVNQSSESEKHKHIAMVNFYNCADPEIRVSFEESKANAVLIAEAPALLDALVRAEQMIRILVLRGVFSGDEAEIAENEAADFRAIVMKAKGLSKEKD